MNEVAPEGSCSFYNSFGGYFRIPYFSLVTPLPFSKHTTKITKSISLRAIFFISFHHYILKFNEKILNSI